MWLAATRFKFQQAPDFQRFRRLIEEILSDPGQEI
jgi:hypothetical protein